MIVPIDAQERVFGTPPELDELAALARVRGRMLGIADATPRIGRYRIVGRLGQGGMGLVHAAHDDELDRPVAIKVLRRDLASADARQRFLREAQALARLSHPNVVQVYEVGHEDDEIFIAMELVEGTTLRRWCAAEIRSWREIVRVFVGAGRGLAAAHRAGLVHRDFKPDNVLIRPSDDGEARARVLDFGVAHFEIEPASTSAPAWAASASGSMTQPGHVMGTVAYMAPEQRWGLRADARADQYAFALSLYEALHGHRPPVESPTTEPHPSMASGELDLDRPARASMRSQSIARERPIPKWLKAVLERAMATNADERWPSMDELLDALAGPKRRTKWIALALAATAAIGATAFAVDRARTIAACDDEAGALASWWQGARADAKAGLVHTGVADAAATWSSAATRMDAWVGDWTATHAAVCRETRVDRTRSETVLAASRACLDERRAWLEALVGIWSHAQPIDIHGVAPAAAAMPPLDACADPMQLQPRLDELARTDSVETLRAGRARLFRVEALRRAGRRADALELVTALVDEVDDAALRAEALTLLGRLHGEVGEFDASEATYERAVVLATEAGRNDLVGDAAAKLVFVTGVGHRRFEDAEYWGALADAAFASANVPAGDSRRAPLTGNRGTVASARGEWEAGLALHREAHEIWETAFGEDHLESISSLENIAIDLSYLGRYGEAGEQYRAVLERRERVLGRQHPLLAATIDNLGTVLRSQGRFGEALELHERALALNIAAHGSEHPRVADSIENIAADVGDLGDDARALELYEQALAMETRTLGDDTADVARLLNNSAIPLTHLGRHADALAACERALAIQERVLGSDHPDLSWSHAHAGEVLYAMGRFADSRAAFTRAVAIRARAMSADSPELAEVRIDLGRACIADGDPLAAVDPLARAAVVLARPDVTPELRERHGVAQAQVLGALISRRSGRSRRLPP